MHARTRTHVSEHFPAPKCTKIAAPARVRVRAHARTLRVWKCRKYIKNREKKEKDERWKRGMEKIMVDT